MQNWRNPWWIFLTGILPTGALLALSSQIYYIIDTQLTPEVRWLWVGLGSGLGLLFLAQLVYFLSLRWRQRESGFVSSVLTFIGFSGWLLAYLFLMNRLIPSDIPTWMVTTDAQFYPFGLLMPNLAFSLYSIIAYLTNFEKDPKAWHNFLAAVGVAFFSYVFLHLMTFRGISSRYIEHLLVLTLGSLSVAFFFFLGRAIYILAHRPWSGLSRWELLIKGVLGMVFPVWGLLLNNGQVYHFMEHVFGNFSSPWFYGLALTNGLLFTLPHLPQPVYRGVLFGLRSLLFPFILYFALVFLPYMPLAIPAILAIGAGFLMLTPIVLIVWQWANWLKDLDYLSAYLPRWSLMALSGLAGLVLPLLLCGLALRDRATLHQALDYVYAPNFEQVMAPSLVEKRLERVFQAIHQNKRRRSFEPVRSSTPYLSHLYNSIVLDNLTLGDRKLNKLEAIFLGKDLAFRSEPSTQASVPQIKSARVDTRWNELDQSWRSTVHLEIENKHETLEEYRTVFELPDGAVVQGYYLYVGQEKVAGTLAEKKTATWIYEQIVQTTRRDPGLLSYLDTRMLSLRVYPFQPKEVRKTGFTILHKEPFNLVLDQQHQLALGDQERAPNQQAPIILASGQLAYLPAAVQATLPKVELEPHYHFVVDCSARSARHTPALIRQIQTFLRSRQISPQRVHLYLTNWEVHPVAGTADWAKQIEQRQKRGGFFVERAFEQILYTYTQHPPRHYPVMVVVTQDFNPVMPDFTPRFAYDVPNGLRYSTLVKQALETRDFASQKITDEQPLAAMAVTAYPSVEKAIHYCTEGSATLLRLPGFKPGAALKQDTWESAALLQAESRFLEEHPEWGEKAWLALIERSFKTNYLTPVTAYMVLENEAQRRFLQLRQRQVLLGKKALDAGEDPVRMSEPGFWVLLTMLLLLLGWKKWFC